MTASVQKKGNAATESGERVPTTEPRATGNFDHFELDIRFVENTPEADGIVFCTTGDGCGVSCPSACTTSLF